MLSEQAYDIVSTGAGVTYPAAAASGIARCYAEFGSLLGATVTVTVAAPSLHTLCLRSHCMFNPFIVLTN